MKNATFNVHSCEECLFFWEEYIKKIGSVPHCNYYNGEIQYKVKYSAKEKHPDCRIINIVVNEED